MNHKIHPDLLELAIPIEQFTMLPGNPRKGKVEAIAALLDEFGQLKPVTARPNEDGTLTISSGNHTYLGALQLGWTHLAAVRNTEQDVEAMVAWALGENRSHELGTNDAILLDAALEQVIDGYVPLFEELGWDDFEMAAIGELADRSQSIVDDPRGYVPPEIILPEPTPAAPQPPPESKPDITAPEGTDTREAIIHGAAATSTGAGGKGVVQYNLVFDTIQQQNRWHAFLRWLRADPGTDGDTTAERLLDFLESRADF